MTTKKTKKTASKARTPELKKNIFIFLFFTVLNLAAAQDALRGEVRIDSEPVYALEFGVELPLSAAGALKWAAEEAALSYSAMIYGWNFDYKIGDASRSIAEDFNLTPNGAVNPSGANLKMETPVKEGGYFLIWSDYKLTKDQALRFASWKTAGIREVQSSGSGALTGKAGNDSFVMVKRAALEDAAKNAVRAALRDKYTNRPKNARGKAALSAFPVYRIEGGRWEASARFRVKLEETGGYGVY
ncbi:MAG: hypothetical protein LBC53_08290 [Spirochaetaceae bacterium]|jgi:hypothetical protein|nr:hypothetical protein [Spirochaetaceae bacterium]